MNSLGLVEDAAATLTGSHCILPALCDGDLVSGDRNMTYLADTVTHGCQRPAALCTPKLIIERHLPHRYSGAKPFALNLQLL